MSDIVEQLRRSLIERDKAASECPVNKPNWRGGPSSCPKCGVGSGHNCPVMTSADHGFVEAARATLAQQWTGEGV